MCAESPPSAVSRLVSPSGILAGNIVYCQRPEAARTREKVGSVMELSVEKIVALRPHLIVASNLTPPAQVDKLRQQGLVAEVFQQPSFFADICNHFLRLGHLLGRGDSRAGRRQGGHGPRRRGPLAAPQGLPPSRGPGPPLHSSIKGPFTPDFIELGGGINVAKGVGDWDDEDRASPGPQP